MRLFLYTNIVVDSVKFREPYVYEAMPIFQMGDAGVHQLLISDLTFANVAYLAKRGGMTLSQLYELLIDLRSHIHVVVVGQDCVDAALHLRPKDFEDALQYFAAKQANADYIITRNKKDFGFSDIPVLEPSEFLSR